MATWRFLISLSLVLMLLGRTVSDSPAADSGQAAEGTQKVLTLQPKEKTLTVVDAVRFGLENHPNIRSAREKIGAQQAVLRQQMAAYYPTINLNGNYQFGNQGSSTAAAPNATTSDFVQVSTTFNLTLYNFGKREGAVQSARETLGATQYNLKTAADTVVLGVKQAYYSYLQALALVKVREETVRDRELIVRQAQAFYEVGTRAKIDLVRAQANLFSAQSDLIAAQNGMKVAWVTLKNAMGLPDLPEAPVAEDTSITTFPLSLGKARAQAFEIRPELLSFDSQLKAQDQTIATNRRGHLPDIVFDANYSRRGADSHNSLPASFPLQGSWQVRFGLNIPIFNGFLTTNKVEESVRTYYSIRASAEQQKQQVALEVEQGYANVLSAQEKIKASKAAQDAAKENLDLANGRYQVGVGSIIEVTDAQATYTSAEVDYVNSLYNYKIAEAQLLKAVGTP
jgi:TolC family type I secretion outer membrane protein